MDTALHVTAGPDRIHPAPSFERFIRRAGDALVAWSGRLERRRPTQAELAERWELRVAAERLREAHRLQAMVRQF